MTVMLGAPSSSAAGFIRPMIPHLDAEYDDPDFVPCLVPRPLSRPLRWAAAWPIPTPMTSLRITMRVLAHGGVGLDDSEPDEDQLPGKICYAITLSMRLSQNGRAARSVAAETFWLVQYWHGELPAERLVPGLRTLRIRPAGLAADNRTGRDTVQPPPAASA